jgi:hypothetical protein
MRSLLVRSLAAAVALTTVAACDSSSHSANPKDPLAVDRILVRRIIKPPTTNYALDTDPGAEGAITPDVFAQYAGGETATKAGYQAGYRINYENPATNEALSITLMQFRSPHDAQAYQQRTAPQTLNLAAATHTPYSAIPGAVAVNGTQAYQGDYQHGVIMTRGDYYCLFVYIVSEQSPTPVEYPGWVSEQYRLLG